MSELVGIGFEHDIHRASSVLSQISNLDYGWVEDFDDAVAVYRDNKGKMHMDQSFQTTSKQGAAWGGSLGLLIGGLLLAPFTGGLSAGVAAGTIAAGALGGAALGATGGALDAASWKDEFGLPQDFVRGVSSLVAEGNSALFAILRTGDPGLVIAKLNDYGGTLVRTPLTAEQEGKLTNALVGSWS